MSHLNLSLLGSPRLELDGVPLEVDTRKAIALLAYLTVTGENHRRDSLINLLWPDYDQARGRTVLRRTLYVLNQTLPDDFLDTDRDTIGVNPSADVWLDVDQFHKNLSECRTHGHEVAQVCPECVEPLTEAIELYRGDFLEGFSLQDSVNFDDWQFSETQSLRSEVMNALERLVSCLLGGDDYEKVVVYDQRWLKLDQANEVAHRGLMEAYAKTGQRTAALRQYEECVRVLEKELGESPQEETTKLYQAIKGNQLQVGEPPPTYKPPKTPSHNLPVQLTSFIGREDEMVKIKRLLTKTHLLTLTGAGGCGKTRLALEVVADLVEEYSDGVWLVELAALADPALVPQEVAGALNVREGQDRSFTDTLRDYLKSKSLLLLNPAELKEP